MMELTRKGEYAVRGIIYLASMPPGRISLLNDVAVAVNVPPTFLAKIFQQFNKAGMVKSYRGTGGGFVLGRPAKEITLLEVVEAVEGTIVPNRCVIGLGECPRTIACSVHPVWKKVQSEVREILASVTIEELAAIQGAKE